MRRRTAGSFGMNEAFFGLRRERGRSADSVGLCTVVLEMPSWVAIRDLDTPPAASRRIYSQPSEVITVPSYECPVFERQECPGAAKPGGAHMR